MPSSIYRTTLSRALYITRQYKFLWFLGFLAAFLGNGGEYEFVITQFNKLSSGSFSIIESLITSFGTGGNNIIRLFGSLAGSIVEAGTVWLGAAVFLLLILIWMIVISQGVLIKMVADLENDKKASFKQALALGRNSFWRLLSILIITRFISFFIFAVIGLPLTALLSYMFDPIKAFFLVTFVLGTPLFVVFSLIAKYAIAYLMLERKNPYQAVAHSLALFGRHWLLSLEMALALFVINILVGALIVLAVLFVAIPFVLLAYALLSASIASGAYVILNIGKGLAFIVLLVLGGALATFQYAVWTELFLRIKEKTHLSKIVSLVAGLRDKYR